MSAGVAGRAFQTIEAIFPVQTGNSVITRRARQARISFGSLEIDTLAGETLKSFI